MNAKNPFYESDNWRERTVLVKADLVWRDANQKRKLLRVAEEYDRLAQRAEQWRAADKA